MKRFSDFDLHPSLENNLVAMKYETPTPIQSKAIPVILEGRDVVACSQTGTGKTAAFLLPLLTILFKSESAKLLVLVPTREIASQIIEWLKRLVHDKPEFRIALLMGGSSYAAQLRMMSRNPRVIIATPGRLIDHLKAQRFTLSDVRHLVLDEADRMFDMGFEPQILQVLSRLSAQRQTLLFSATLPPHVTELVKKHLKNPVPISVGKISAPATLVKQSVIHTTREKKDDVLMDELNMRQGSVLIFTRTKSRTDQLADFLEEYGYEVSRIHGDRTQGQRRSALAGFREGNFRILVATDIAARGIDIPHIAHVINYDLPEAIEDYVHRIGRTARAGATGEAISLLTPEDKYKWDAITKMLGPPKEPAKAKPVAVKKVLPKKPTDKPARRSIYR